MDYSKRQKDEFLRIAVDVHIAMADVSRGEADDLLDDAYRRYREAGFEFKDLDEPQTWEEIISVTSMFLLSASFGTVGWDEKIIGYLLNQADIPMALMFALENDENTHMVSVEAGTEEAKQVEGMLQDLEMSERARAYEARKEKDDDQL